MRGGMRHQDIHVHRNSGAYIYAPS
jgi:hypothetical protein